MAIDFDTDFTEMTRNRQENHQTGPEFFEPRDRIPKAGKAEFMYKRMMKAYNANNFADNSQVDLPYLEFEGLYYQNYFGYVADWVKSYSGN